MAKATIKAFAFPLLILAIAWAIGLGLLSIANPPERLVAAQTAGAH